ncbi:hypothetical protein N656DRAFT_704092, partial [Canariomyces notabilis]
SSCRRQCQGPRNLKNEGEQMSQGESAPRPASRHSSRSPPTAVASSSPARRSRIPQDDSRSRTLHGPGGVAVTGGGGDGRGQQPGSRALDSHEISTPAGPPHEPAVESSAGLPQPSVAGGNPRSVMVTGQYGTEGSPSHPFASQTPGAQSRTSNNPLAPPTPSPVAASTASVDHGSPTIVHPYPLAARRILTPKSPRAASLSRAALRTVEAQHQHLGHLAAPMPRSGTTAQDVQTLGSGSPSLGALQFQGRGSGQGTAVLPPTRPPSGLARSLSQPSLGQGLPSGPPTEPSQPGGLKRELSGRPVFSGPPFAAPLPAPHRGGFGPSGLSGDSRWGTGVLGSLPPGASAARHLQIAEGQTLLTITPRHGEEIVVPVDVHQASKQADEKRQRNAGASARFRQRKKEREREQQEGMQKLENQNRELEKRVEELVKQCQELEAQRDFYQNERNRLRVLVARTPGISEWADRRPPSPVPARSGTSFVPPDNSTLLPQPPPPPAPTTGHSHPHAQTQSRPTPYPHTLASPHPRSSSYGDPSMLEPPARRRRTDSEPQLPSTSYSLMPPAPIPGPPPPPPPPIPPPASFGIPPSPHITPPPGAARLPPLPPLRFDQSRAPSTTPPPMPSAPPQPSVPPQSASPYPTYRKLHYETGWATEPRGQTEGGPR